MAVDPKTVAVIDPTSGKLPEPDLSSAPQEFELKLETGEVYKGKSWEEIAQKVGAGKTEASKTIKGLKDQNTVYQNQVAVEEARKQQATAPKNDNFDTNRYYELFAQNPLEAFQYGLGALMGVQPEYVPAALRYSLDEANISSSYRANAEFRANYPDAPSGDEFADSMIQRMSQKGRDWSADNLGITYAELKREGVAKAVETAPVVEEAPKIAPTLKGGGGGATGNEGLVEKAWDMDLKDLDKYMQKLGMK